MMSIPITVKVVFLCFLCTLGACGGKQSPTSYGDVDASLVAIPSIIPTVIVPPVSVVPDTVSGRPSVAPEVWILVIGQSIASNCNEKIYGPLPNVFQVGLTGEIEPASDPFVWADCRDGSMWMPLGKLLIDAGMASKVTFMPIGIGGTAVADWQNGGRAYSKLNAAIEVIARRNIHFDYAFWHQGSSDFGTKRSVYTSRLNSVIDYVNKNIRVDRFFVSIHSRCFGTWDREIEAAQLDVIASAQERVFLGPNNNSLDDTYRIDGCHLNAGGQEKMASLWLQSIKVAK